MNEIIKYSLSNPFTLEHARQLEGRDVTVFVKDMGLTGKYIGLLKLVDGEFESIDADKTQIGDDVLMNDCICSLQVN